MATSDDEEATLRDQDFDAYRREKHRDAFYNEERLAIRRRLAAIGERAKAVLAADGICLEARASLHHPYKFNQNCVDSQRVYLSRSKAERRPLKSILGVDLGKDVDADYIHLILYVSIDFVGIEVGLQIHRNAWWDGENLKRKVAETEGRNALTDLLNALPEGFRLSIHDWRHRHESGSIMRGHVARVFEHYKPGEHRLQIRREIPRGDKAIGTPELSEALVEDLRACGPIYRFALWTPENNLLFAKE